MQLNCCENYEVKFLEGMYFRTRSYQFDCMGDLNAGPFSELFRCYKI